MQFAQIALVVTEKAAFEDMRVKAFVQHSLVLMAQTTPDASFGPESAACQ